MTGRGVCGRCGVRKRGRAARTSAPVTDCVRCGVPICNKHMVEAPDEGGYVCTKCHRAPRPEREEAPT